MTKLTLNNVVNGGTTGITSINANSDLIEVAFENTLSRDGTSPNQMNADFDMNNNDILNVGLLSATDITVDGSDVTGVLSRAETAAINAETSETNAAASAAASAASAALAASIATINFDTYSEMVADTTLVYSGVGVVVTAGTIIEAQGLRFEVASSASVDNDEITVGGVKLYSLNLRNVKSATYAAGLPDGSIFNLGGLLYLVDSTATGADSCTNDLGVDGLVPYGPAEQGHFSGWAAFDAWLKLPPAWRSIRLTRPTAGTYNIFPGDRGLLVRLAQSEIGTIYLTPNDTWVTTDITPNNSLAGYKVANIDVDTHPNDPRREGELTMHRDIDSADRMRLATRAYEGALHPDWYFQINGAHPYYVAKKRDGTTGKVSFGLFAPGFRLKEGLGGVWTPTTAITVGETRTVPQSDHLYLECYAVSTGITGATVPALGQPETTVVDGGVSWVIRTRLWNSDLSDYASPVILGDENGNSGFGTQWPKYDYDAAKRFTFRQGIAFDNGGSLGSTLLNIRSATAEITFGSVNSGAAANFDIAVTGAALGDSVALGIPYALTQTGIHFQSFVSSAGNVRVEVQNTSASPIVLAAGTFRVTVFKF